MATDLNWSLHHVNINALDLKASLDFYRTLIGMNGANVITTRANEKVDSVTFTNGVDVRGLHLCTPDMGPQFTKLPINPTVGGHFAINVPDIEAVRRRLDAAGIVYSAPPYGWAMRELKQIYVYDPSMNVVEINEVDPNIVHDRSLVLKDFR
jgi:catechol 2,3-dioxygenase-like lactoylglutathione lyase family enzyme